MAPHPSLKPQRFLRQIVRASLPLGVGVIYDPFAGSGSTLAAAEAVGYRAVGTDRDLQYLEMGCKAFTGLVAAEFVEGFPARKFSAGLLVAFIDLFTNLGVPGAGMTSLTDVLTKFPRQLTTAAGARANTLILAAGKGTVSLRPFYNAIERFFRAEHKRFDYPSCAPHATQPWADYTVWLDSLATFSPVEMADLRQKVCDFVLDILRSQEFDPASVAIEPPVFRLILENFDFTRKKGEPTGATLQGVVFGFLRADNPHLQIEIDKVRTGSKRLQRVGDIDGWEGARLAISAKVKQLVPKLTDLPDLEAFANETGGRGALGAVVALGFDSGVRDAIEGLGVKALDVHDIVRIVELWDPLKQRTAVTSLVYYVRHVEKNSALAERLEAFLDAASQRLPEAL